MDQSITLALIGIVPAIIASIVTYGVSSKKTKVDLIKIINQSNDKLRLEVKEELEECRKDREAIRSELNVYKKENENVYSGEIGISWFYVFFCSLLPFQI